MSRLRSIRYATLRGLSGPWRAVTRLGQQQLRILAYHGVPDPDRFDAQMAHLAAEYRVVGGPHFAETRKESPPVWITFDDGDPTIVDNALGVMAKYGFTATAFVCPSVIDTEDALWWQVVQDAVEAEIVIDGEKIPSGEVGRLKLVPDAERRDRLDRIREELSRMRAGRPRRQLNQKALTYWLDAGLTLGNHTWDHPLLDKCSPEEQRRQIDLAHSWFIEHGYGTPSWFAYPNGNWSASAEQRLAELDYEVALLFDHGLATKGNGMNLSRIRVNGTDSLDEFIPKVAGIHPVVTRWRT